MDLSERLRALAGVLPLLEAPDVDFGHWVLPPSRDGEHVAEARTQLFQELVNAGYRPNPAGLR
jgi:hypothetical protein